MASQVLPCRKDGKGEGGGNGEAESEVEKALKALETSTPVSEAASLMARGQRYETALCKEVLALAERWAAFRQELLQTCSALSSTRDKRRLLEEPEASSEEADENSSDSEMLQASAERDEMHPLKALQQLEIAEGRKQRRQSSDAKSRGGREGAREGRERKPPSESVVLLVAEHYCPGVVKGTVDTLYYRENELWNALRRRAREALSTAVSARRLGVLAEAVFSSWEETKRAESSSAAKARAKKAGKGAAAPVSAQMAADAASAPVEGALEYRRKFCRLAEEVYALGRSAEAFYGAVAEVVGPERELLVYFNFASGLHSAREEQERTEFLQSAASLLPEVTETLSQFVLELRGEAEGPFPAE